MMMAEMSIMQDSKLLKWLGFLS